MASITDCPCFQFKTAKGACSIYSPALATQASKGLA